MGKPGRMWFNEAGFCRKQGGMMRYEGVLLAAALAASVDGVSASQPERMHQGRQQSAMEMLRPGAVQPAGWLRDGCLTAKKGYISRMDEVDPAFPRAWGRDFHPRGKYLDWVDPDKGAWCTEGGAYWFEGLVRLAWELDDPELKAYAKKRLEPLLEKMNPNAIGFVYWMDRNDPAQMAEIERANHGFIVGASGRTTRALLAYWEATGDACALRALTWCVNDSRFYFFGNPITLPAAGFDVWRYSGDPAVAAALDTFYGKKTDLSWPAMRYALPVNPGELEMSPRAHSSEWDWRRQHGVLYNESLLSWIKGTLWTGDPKHLTNALSWLEFLEAHAKQPHGVIVADESYGWAGPNRGTETCTVAGDILTYSTLISVMGEGRFGDHVERSFFNAGAACTSRDWMHHVYFQSPNRVSRNLPSYITGPGPQGGNYETKHWPLCCTAALTRILPSYIQFMWMKPREGGLAAALYGPCKLVTELGGKKVTIDSKTDYPFNEVIEMTVKPEKAFSFPLRLRLPVWCAKAELTLNGTPVAYTVTNGFAVVDHAWSEAGDTMTLRFPMAPVAERMHDRNDGAKPYCSIAYGPLLFAYGLPEKDENTPAAGARTDWKVDSSCVLEGAQVIRSDMPAQWDWPLDAPLKLAVKAADGTPLTLVPYGCTKLRISLFPDTASCPAF